MAARLPRSPGQRQGVARRMTTGLAGGRSAVVAPAPERPREMVQAPTGPREKLGPWSHAGALTVTTSGDEPVHTVLVGGLLDTLYASLRTAGSASTVVTYYLNGVSIGTVTLTSSDDYEADGITPVLLVPGDRVHARITTAGAGAKGLETWAEAA